jgi:hypothetical protein
LDHRQVDLRLRKGKSLLSFKLQIGGSVAFFIVAILAPLLMFTPQMAQAKRKGLADYGLLAQQYVEGFERKWILHNPTLSEELLGAGDIQSLADLGNSYALVREMRSVPFGIEDISRLAAALRLLRASTAHYFLPGGTSHAHHQGRILKN